MPNLIVKLYSVIFKYQQKHLLQSLIETPESTKPNPFGITSRPSESIAASNPSFSDGVATKDIHVDPFSSLSLRIFLPDTAVTSSLSSNYQITNYGGYSPAAGISHRKLPVMLQFHGGGFVSGSNDSVGNDAFCRRIAKLCDVIVVAVGYRLAPETKYPGAFEDGFKVLNWLAKQANLAVCGRVGAQSHIFDSFGASMVEPWLAAHGDTSRISPENRKLMMMLVVSFSLCVLLGVSSGANIADYVAREAVEAGKRLDPVKVVAQILMFPFFIGSTPTHSEIKLSSSYFYDKTMCMLAWKLFLPKEEFNLDHPAANPLIAGRQPPLKCMPPTLTVVAEHDFMRDRAIAYSEELRKVNVDAPLLDYKDGVHEFATLDVLLQTPQARFLTTPLVFLDLMAFSVSEDAHRALVLSLYAVSFLLSLELPCSVLFPVLHHKSNSGGMQLLISIILFGCCSLNAIGSHRTVLNCLVLKTQRASVFASQFSLVCGHSRTVLLGEMIANLMNSRITLFGSYSRLHMRVQLLLRKLPALKMQILPCWCLAGNGIDSAPDLSESEEVLGSELKALNLVVKGT
ncbi:hypothetical protein POTOM_032149 [Populus tomentosa]|uniref:Alpha/beta hydrolase fold-3 domain-containing protein n=1 Tax=Populus tomentosa TaxID=118781 RepID=A0A8X7Z5G0_POPTO|nr:hypothetical protein POTOM_032149 [Populus tomentosa]